MKLPPVLHLNIDVKDLERSRRFYVDLLGMEVNWSVADMVALRAGEFDFFISQAARERALAVDALHFGFRLRDRAELDAWETALRAKGVAASERRGEDAFYVKDPDGYTVEFYCD